MFREPISYSFNCFVLSLKCFIADLFVENKSSCRKQLVLKSVLSFLIGHGVVDEESYAGFDSVHKTLFALRSLLCFESFQKFVANG